jgi:peptidoglycan/LPS O-acetylase OafA/YrhL
MYLWHYPFAYGPWNVFDGLPWGIRIVALAAVTYTLATASWFLVERRFLARH